MGSVIERYEKVKEGHQQVQHHHGPGNSSFEIKVQYMIFNLIIIKYMLLALLFHSMNN
jgi:hypothetical protein